MESPITSLSEAETPCRGSPPLNDGNLAKEPVSLNEDLVDLLAQINAIKNERIEVEQPLDARVSERLLHFASDELLKENKTLDALTGCFATSEIAMRVAAGVRKQAFGGSRAGEMLALFPQLKLPVEQLAGLLIEAVRSQSANSDSSTDGARMQSSRSCNDLEVRNPPPTAHAPRLSFPLPDGGSLKGRGSWAPLQSLASQGGEARPDACKDKRCVRWTWPVHASDVSMDCEALDLHSPGAHARRGGTQRRAFDEGARREGVRARGGAGGEGVTLHSPPPAGADGRSKHALPGDSRGLATRWGAISGRERREGRRDVSRELGGRGGLLGALSSLFATKTLGAVAVPSPGAELGGRSGRGGGAGRDDAGAATGDARRGGDARWMEEAAAAAPQRATARRGRAPPDAPRARRSFSASPGASPRGGAAARRGAARSPEPAAAARCAPPAGPPRRGTPPRGMRLSRSAGSLTQLEGAARREAAAGDAGEPPGGGLRRSTPRGARRDGGAPAARERKASVEVKVHAPPPPRPRGLPRARACPACACADRARADALRGGALWQSLMGKVKSSHQHNENPWG